MEACLLSIPLREIELNNIQQRFFDTFFAVKLNNFKKANINFNSISNIVYQDISMLSIAAFIKNNSNHKIYYYNLRDFNIKTVPEFKIYGISCISSNYSVAKKIAMFIKKRFPDSIIVVGGHHATYLDEEVLSSGAFDIVVRGEGELVFKNILDCIEKNRDLANVNGITFIENGKLIRTPYEKRIEGNQIPIPAYEFIRGKELPAARLFTSRGCPHNCSFCSNVIMKRKVKYRNVDDILKEMEILYNEFGTRMFYIGDETFLVDKNRTLKKIAMIDSFKEDVYWIFQTRPDNIPLEIIQKLKQCKNLLEIDVGIENVNDSILKLNNKKLTFKQTFENLNKLKKTNKLVMGYWMIGLPGENVKTIVENLEAMKSFLMDKLVYLIELGCFVPYPGTDIFQNPKKYGINIISRNYDNYSEECPPSFNLKDISSKEIFKNYLYILKELTKFYLEMEISFEKMNINYNELDYLF